MRTAGQGLGFGEVLDAGFQVFRAAFWQLALAQALVAVPVAIIQAIWLPAELPTSPIAALNLFAAHAPVTLVIGVLGILQAGTVAVVADQGASGQGASAWLAYRQTLSRFPELLGFGLAYAVLIGVGLTLVVIPGIAVAVWLSQGLFLIVLERRGIVQAALESYRLVAGRFWRVVGIAVVAYLTVTVISLLVAILIPAPAANGWIAAAITTLVQILIGSFPLVALYIQFRELRRTAGFASWRD